MSDTPGGAAALPWQEEALRRLKDAGLHSSLLIRGPKGIGKYQLARALARAHVTGDDPEAEGIFDSGNHPDFLPVEPQKDEEKKRGDDPITIDQVRELVPFCMHTPKLAPRRIVVVYPACRMGHAAANSLLKLLEEPPELSGLILVAHRPDLLPATVLSRCRTFNAPVPSHEDTRKWLASLKRECPKTLLDLYGHAPVDFLRLEDPETLTHLIDFLREDRLPMVGPMAATLDKSKDKEGDKKNIRPPDWMEWIAKWVADVAAVRFGVAPTHFAPMGSDLERIARRAGHLEWLNLQADLCRMLAVSATSVNARMLAERALGDYVRTAHPARKKR